MKFMSPRIVVALMLSFLAVTGLSQDASVEIVQEITIRGNAKVESDAILTLLKTKKADPLRASDVQEDIRTLYELGYFSDVRFYKSSVDGGIALVVQVAEKPAIVSIDITGNEELTEDNIREKLSTKLFTIVNEATITNDVRVIAKQYSEKGFYLASVTYDLTLSSFLR